MIEIHETMTGEETEITIIEKEIVKAVKIATETDTRIDIILIAEIVINMTGKINDTNL